MTTIDATVKALMQAADSYAHVYAFVSDDTMPKYRADLEAALHAALSKAVRPVTTPPMLLSDGTDNPEWLAFKHSLQTVTQPASPVQAEPVAWCNGDALLSFKCGNELPLKLSETKDGFYKTPLYAAPVTQPVSQTVEPAPVSTAPNQPMILLRQKISAHFEGCASATFGWQSSDPNGREKAQAAHNQKCIDLIYQELQALTTSQAAKPYDQTALELCEMCGWKTLIPDDCCLNCERDKAQPEQPAEEQEFETSDDEVGNLVYRGNSVSYIYQKMQAYSKGISGAWKAMADIGAGADGKTDLPTAIRRLAATSAKPEGDAKDAPFGWYSAKEDDFMTNKIREAHIQCGSYTHIHGKYDKPLYTHVEGDAKDAEMLDWIGLHGSFGTDSITNEVGGNGQRCKAATRKNIIAAIASQKGG